MGHRKILQMAAKASRMKRDARTFYHAAIGIDKDGDFVCALNVSAHAPAPHLHAERRVIAKANKITTIYVVRTTANGDWALSKPCAHCEKAIKNAGIKRVVYSTGPNSYQVVML